MKLSIIVAMAQNNVIGLNNQMPWHIPADLAWFKHNTLHKPVIMGRKTFESIGRPLPNRLNIVISRTAHASSHDNVVWVSSLEQALDIVKDKAEAFIIGGGNLYQQALPLVTRLYLTHINADLAGDTYFPNYQATQWQTVHSEQHHKDEKNAYDYRFEILEKITV